MVMGAFVVAILAATALGVLLGRVLHALAVRQTHVPPKVVPPSKRVRR